ncbi:IclR family transcriptional regulator [Nocardia sp. NPDC003963]
MVTKVAALLRAIGGQGSSGSATSDLARAVGIPRPTAHRLLASLVDEGLVDRDPRSGRWFLGPEMYLLGSVAASRYDITGYAHDVLEGLAQSTGESAFLSARRGDETVCLLEREGSFPLRSHVLREGRRFPLGVASAGLAILSHLPVDEIDAFLLRADLGPWGPAHRADAIRDRIAVTRQNGYALNPGLLVEGSWGMGAAVFDRAGRPAWALSLTGVESRFGSTRSPELGTLLVECAHQLSKRLEGKPG